MARPALLVSRRQPRSKFGSHSFRVHCVGRFVASALAAPLFLAALSHGARAEAVGDKPSFPTLIYWDNWTDAQGVSHLNRCKITSFRPLTGHGVPATPKAGATAQNASSKADSKTTADSGKTDSGKAGNPKADSAKTANQPLIWKGMNRPGGATITTVVQPPNWKGEWTVAEHAKWIVPLAGTYVVEAMDGERVELNPGDLLLSEDMGSKRNAKGERGHRSGNVGKNAVALLIAKITTPAAPTHQACSQN